MIPNGTNQNSRRLPGRRSAKEVVESIAHPHPSPAFPPSGTPTRLPSLRMAGWRSWEAIRT